MNLNHVHEEIKSRLKISRGKPATPRYLNLSFSRLLSKSIKINVSWNIIFLALWDFETWSNTLKEGQRLKVFGNRALRKIFWPKRDEIRVQKSKLHNEELHDKKGVYLARNVACMGNRKVPYQAMVGKPEGNAQFGRTSCRWEDYSKTGVQETGWEGVDWLYLAQGKGKMQALANNLMNFRGNFFVAWGIIAFQEGLCFTEKVK